MFIRLTTLLLLAFFMMPVSANAVDYTVSNLAVDVEGETAIDAREKALTKARANAFNILKKRIAPGAQTNTIPTPDDMTIASMVNSFEINREKLSNNRYLASVNVAFNQRAVQGYMNRYSNNATTGPSYASGNMNTAAPYQQDNANGQSSYQQQQSATQRQYGRQDTMQGMSSSASLNQSKIRVDIAGIRQWINVKKMLESMYSIQNIEIDQISSRQAIISLNHTGTINDLQNDLIGRGMRLYANTDASSALQVPYILVTRG